MKRRILSLCMAVLMVMSVFAVCGGALTASNATASAAEEGEWIGAWGAGMTNISFADYPDLYVSVKKIAGRMIITPTASGNKLRLRISNVYGTRPLVIENVRVNKCSSEGGYKVKAPGYKVYYNDSAKITVPAGEEILTDPVNMPVVAQQDIAVTMYIADSLQDITTVALSGGKTYLAPFQDKFDSFEDLYLSKGNFLSLALSSSMLRKFIPALDNLPDLNIVPLLSGVEVYNTQEDPYSVVIIGDSTVANEFPAYLSKRIAAEDCTSIGIIGKGIIGNSLLSDGQGKVGNIYGPSLLKRTQIDVLSQSGVKYAVIKIGGNDITHPVSADADDYGNRDAQPTAQQLIDGYKKFIKLCNSYGIEVIGCTITQWNGTKRNYFGTDSYEWTQEDWQIAQDVNAWMRTSDEFCAVYDLEKLSARANDPTYLRSDWTSDNIHPNKTAQQVWADEFPLEAIGVKTIPRSVTINPNSITLAVGKTYELEESIYPESASFNDVTWKSSDPSIVSVSNDGTIKALKNGKATITCTTANGKSAKCAVTVQTPTTGVTLSATTLSLYVTHEKKITATVKPAAAENKSVKWTTSDASVATVSKKGTVTAKKAGVAVITCTTVDTGKSASCTVTVKNGVKADGISLNASKKTVYKGKTYQLNATVTPSNARNKTVIWKSGDTDVAIVSSSGKVTAVGNGTAYITATTQDGGYTAVCKITVKTKVTGVSLNKSSKTVYIGKTYDLNATVTPKSASNKSVKWTSSDKSIATVNSKGVVTGKKLGTVTITCTTADGGYKASCKVKVAKYVKAASVSLNKTSIKLAGGKTYQLSANVAPSNASNKSVKWTSSDTSVAKVSSTGKVTALKKGTATITCTTSSGSYKATCKVTVTSTAVKSVSLNKSSAELDVGDTLKLKATVNPSSASNKSVTWSSSNKSVAKVSSTGKVTAVGDGVCTITCKTANGKTAKCKITVYGDTYDIGDSDDEFATVSLNTGEIVLSKSGTYTLKATTNPAGIAVKWTSTNPSVAKVSSTGKVTAVGSGTCMIKCTTKSGSWTATCKVTVK